MLRYNCKLQDISSCNVHPVWQWRQTRLDAVLGFCKEFLPITQWQGHNHYHWSGQGIEGGSCRSTPFRRTFHLFFSSQTKYREIHQGWQRHILMQMDVQKATSITHRHRDRTLKEQACRARWRQGMEVSGNSKWWRGVSRSKMQSKQDILHVPLFGFFISRINHEQR